MAEIELTGPRGDNPLGFLTALGVLVVLEDAGSHPRLFWRGLRPVLLLDGSTAGELDHPEPPELRKWLVSRLAALLRRAPAKKGQPPDPSVSLGKDLNKPNREFLEHIDAAAAQASAADRRWVELVAAFGVADPADLEKRMGATPWVLVSGSGHQHFLGSLAELMVCCEEQHFERALFGPWLALDEKYSLRLDIEEDRRHALMDRDPTATGNKPKTIWGANRLAFEALRLFPAMPARGGIAVCAWHQGANRRGEGWTVRWALWCEPTNTAVVGSLLRLPELWQEGPPARARLRALGVHAVYESRRIVVGDPPNVKFNLTPPVAVWCA